MRGEIRGAMIFAAGVFVGSLVTWRFTKGKYARLAQEEIDSVKAAFARRKEKPRQAVEEAQTVLKENEARKGGSVIEYAKKLQEAGYIPKDEPLPIPSVEKPYVISPDEFGEFCEYSKNSLTFYADGVLVDENNELVDDVDGTVGLDSLNHFGEYEDDAVHVRNDARKSDYEILLDTRRYEDVLKTMPPQPLEE